MEPRFSQSSFTYNSQKEDSINPLKKELSMIFYENHLDSLTNRKYYFPFAD